jgi:hypothetical protein
VFVAHIPQTFFGDFLHRVASLTPSVWREIVARARMVTRVSQTRMSASDTGSLDSAFVFVCRAQVKLRQVQTHILPQPWTLMQSLEPHRTHRNDACAC